VAATPDVLVIVVNIDGVPERELLSNSVVRLIVSLPESTERVIGEYDSPAIRVVLGVTFEYRDIPVGMFFL